MSEPSLRAADASERSVKVSEWLWIALADPSGWRGVARGRPDGVARTGSRGKAPVRALVRRLEPRRPRHVHPFARAFLERLERDERASAFVLGGYFALMHYLEYRSTNDIDAWWSGGRRQAGLEAARVAFRETASEFGWDYRERSWGDTVSLEAFDGARKAFSFQVAERTIELAPPVFGLWGSLAVESLDDNLGAKMNALVSRGAPRDFVDVKAIVDAGLADIEDCWALWLRKNPGATLEYGKMAVQNNLAALIARTPLTKLAEDRRGSAQDLRTWFRDTFAEE